MNIACFSDFDIYIYLGVMNINREIWEFFEKSVTDFFANLGRCHIEGLVGTLCNHLEGGCRRKLAFEVCAECFFELAVPTISVSKPHFDEASMTVSFDVTPSEETDHWFYGIYDDAEDAKYTVVEGNERRTPSTRERRRLSIFALSRLLPTSRLRTSRPTHSMLW